MNFIKLFQLSSFLIVLSYGAAGYSDAIEERDRTGVDTRFDKNKSLFGAIQKANRLTLYEGLPHQFYERKELTEEKRKKETIALHGFGFYRDPITVSAPDKRRLLELLADEGSFAPWQGERKCGGFHPDWCAEWRVGDAVYQFLICFGCHEAKVYGPDKNLRCDIRTEACTQLERLLKKHRKNRPLGRLP
jgi:hypothetical protein